MDTTQINTIFVILGVLGGVVGGYVFNDTRYVKGKKILASMRLLLDEVDNAVYDDKVTEEEFRGCWEKLKGVYGAIMS